MTLSRVAFSLSHRDIGLSVLYRNVHSSLTLTLSQREQLTCPSDP